MKWIRPIVGLLFLTGQPAAAQDENPAAPPVLARQVRFESYAPVLQLSGSIEAARTLSLAFRTGGRIVERLADVGDTLGAGEVVARLDASQQRAALSAAEAMVNAARAQRDQARSTHARLEALLAGGSTTRSAVEDARAALRSAESSLETADADVIRARDALDDTILRVPVRGVVTARLAEAGEVIQPGQPIYTVAEDGARDAVFDVYEAALLSVDQDVAVELEVLANGRHRFAGKVREIAPSVDPVTGTIPVKVSVFGADEEVSLGATVIAQARTRARDAVILPASALALGREGSAVWVVAVDGNRLDLRPVEVLAFGTNEVAILSGLVEGETVVIRGPRAMRPGLVVAPLAEAGQ